jgi:hypothetical protein
LELAKLEQLNADYFTQEAERLGEVIWERGLLVSKGPGLCHGFAGSVLSLISIADHTRLELWRSKATLLCAAGCQLCSESNGKVQPLLQLRNIEHMSWAEGVSGLGLAVYAITSGDYVSISGLK